jgi:hypothetical protein
MKVAIWHQHGSWMNAFVQGSHEYLLPTTPERDAEGRGRAGRDWPSAVEVSPGAARGHRPDVVIVQREKELTSLVEQWFGTRPALDVPVVVLEHNMPRGDIADMRHWAADRDDLVIVHVTHHNALLWDTGSTRCVVIEHGIPDPGYLFTGELAAGAAVINEATRRWRLVGTDLLAGFADIAPVDLYGMGNADIGNRAPGITDAGDVPHPQLHREVARHRCYLHLNRWTSLGLSLLEAMMAGVPPIAVAATEAPATIPAGGGIVSNDLDLLHARYRAYLADPELAAAEGLVARQAACERHGLGRFLHDWDALLTEVTS